MTRRLYIGLVAVALALPLNACQPEAAKPPLSSLAPVIEEMLANPLVLTSKDQSITFSVKARDPGGKALQYSWSASRGTLSATKGASVSWKPLKSNGEIDAGLLNVTVTVANGTLPNSKTLLFVVAEDGTVKPAPAIPHTTIQPTPGPSASPSAGPSANPSASPACSVGEVSPTLAAPGTIFTVGGSYGKAQPSDVTVQLGPYDAPVVAVEPNRITARVPANVPVTDEALAVVVNVCGKALTADGALRVAATDAFGGTVSEAKQGLLATIYALPEGTDKLPADLGSRKVFGSFLAASLDLPQRAFTTGFPGPDGDLIDWFAIRYSGVLTVPAEGPYKFSLGSDDGAKLYLDDQLVVDNDGQHGMTVTEGSIDLKAGKHKLRLDYFQAQRYGVGLQLYWTLPGDFLDQVVPASAYSRE